MIKPRKFSDLTPSEKQVIIEALASSHNMSEFLECLERKFQLTNCIPNTVTKKMISTGMVNIILPMINPVIR